MCNLHCHFTLNLSYSSTVWTAPQIGNWPNHSSLPNSILESRGIELWNCCQCRKFSCCPAPCLFFVYDVCVNRSTHKPGGSCSNKWKFEFTVSWLFCKVLKTNHKLLSTRYRSTSNVQLFAHLRLLISRPRVAACEVAGQKHLCLMDNIRSAFCR